MQIAVEINAHVDGRHCGKCRGRYWDGTRCSFFLRGVRQVGAAEFENEIQIDEFLARAKAELVLGMRVQKEQRKLNG